jgi:integrase
MRQEEPGLAVRAGLEAGSQCEWIEAVAAFTEDLAERGYSAYTLRDYRSDVLRMATLVQVPPLALGEEHRGLVEAALEGEGMTLAARRRRLSAFNRFLAFMRTRREPVLVGPAVFEAAGNVSPSDQLLVGLVYLGCLRLAEVAHLEGRDVRLRKATLTTRLGYRILPLHPRLAEVVRGMRFHAPLATYRPVLPGIAGFPVNARTLHGRFQRLAAASGHVGLKPDALRREMSRFLIHDGAPPGLVKAFLGKERQEPLAPRRGRLLDLTCLRERLGRVPV